VRSGGLAGGVVFVEVLNLPKNEARIKLKPRRLQNGRYFVAGPDPRPNSTSQWPCGRKMVRSPMDSVRRCSQESNL
jgi:hypothetical protein